MYQFNKHIVEYDYRYFINFVFFHALKIETLDEKLVKGRHLYYIRNILDVLVIFKLFLGFKIAKINKR
jgi:hypothetical protein